MENNSTPSNAFNPVTLWTDVGLRALEMTLSSTQSISDGLDRLTRASASPMVIEEAEAAASEAIDEAASVSSSGLALTAQIQRTTFDLLVQAWQQFMNAAGALAAMGAGRSLAEPVKRQGAWLLSMGQGAQPGRSSRGNGHQRYARNGAMEHAAATGEPKRRSRGGRTKSKARSRSS